MKKVYIIILTVIIVFICSADIFDSCKQINKIIKQNTQTTQFLKIEK
jgi:hypothetical protein